MERNRFINIMAAFLAALMLALSFVVCAEEVVGQIEESMSE